jgi:hypothetical protein
MSRHLALNSVALRVRERAICAPVWSFEMTTSTRELRRLQVCSELSGAEVGGRPPLRGPVFPPSPHQITTAYVSTGDACNRSAGGPPCPQSAEYLIRRGAG